MEPAGGVRGSQSERALPAMKAGAPIPLKNAMRDKLRAIELECLSERLLREIEDGTWLLVAQRCHPLCDSVRDEFHETRNPVPFPPN